MKNWKKISRRDFLEKGVLGACAVFFASIAGRKKTDADVSCKEARHYKNLAG